MFDYSSCSDKDLINAIQSEDRYAFNELYSRYVDDLFTFIFSKLKDIDESKDIVQEIFVYIWSERKNIIEIQSVSSYLYRIAMNKTLNIFRRQQINQNYIDSLVYFLENSTEDLEADQIELQREQELLTALNSLPPKMRTVFELRYFEGLSNEQVAQRLGISAHTVATQMKRALKAIRGKMNLFVFVALLISL